jgi:hypothetical protein
MQRFTNNRDGLSKSLAEQYIDFSVDYPDSWKLSPRTPSDTAFVGVARVGKSDAEVIEAMGIGEWHASTPLDERPEVRADFLARMTRAVAEQVPDFRELSQGSTDVAGRQGYEVRFSCNLKTVNAKGWGRIILLDTRRTRGLTVSMIVTNLAPEFRGIEDVCTKGDLPRILNSLRVAD